MSRSIRGDKRLKKVCDRAARLNNQSRYNKRNSALLYMSDADNHLKGTNL